MNNATLSVLLASLLFAPPLSGADAALPLPFELSLRVTRSGFHVATIEQRWEWFDNGAYRYRSEAHTTGLISLFRRSEIVEESNGRFHSGRLQPLRYRYRRVKGGREHTKAMVFDWQSGEAEVVSDGVISRHPIEAGMLDKLLYQIKIMHDLALGVVPSSYTVLDGAKRKVYEFEYLGEEHIETPLGQVTSQKLIRRRRGSRETVMLWCAEELSYLPIKVVTIDKMGNKTVAVVQMVEFGEQRPAGEKAE